MPLSQQETYEIWAPADSRWSVWAKPILFAHAPTQVSPMVSLEAPDVSAYSYARETAVIVDLPGAASALVGMALAELGYQPVPLYNSARAPGAIINMGAIADVLVAGAERVRRAPKRTDAMPAFLMNADRLDHPNAALMPGRYDNRWVLAPQDMPSATFLTEAGVKKVLLVAAGVANDVAHVLYRYQEAGLELLHAKDVSANGSALTVTKPGQYKSHWYRLGVFAGLRRNAAGGFGAIVPDPNSGGGG